MNIIKLINYKSQYTVLLFLVLFLFQSNVMALNNSLKLFELSSTLKLDSINSLLLSKSFEVEEFEGGDTIVQYELGTGSVGIQLMYCPISRIVYSYYYGFTVDPETKDELTPNNLLPPDYSNMDFTDSIISLNHWEDMYCKEYFLNVLDSLIQKHGKPTYFKIDHSPKYEGNRIDTLKSVGYDYFSVCHLNVNWNNKEREITLSYYRRHIGYEYLNYSNQTRMNDELALLKQQEEKKEILNRIIIGTIILLLVFIIIWFTYKRIKLNQEKRREEEAEANRLNQIRKREKLEKWKQDEEELIKLEKNHKQYISSLVEKYGSCDKTIKIDCKHLYSFDEILVFGQTKHVVIRRREYDFSDILDCVVNDNIKEIETIETYSDDSIATSNTDTGSMIGRAIVGGVLLGGAGAIIGGSTAKRNTVIEHGTDTSIHNKEVEHNYTVAITVKDISNPVLYLNVGGNTELKDEIVSLMKVIMSMK